MKKLKPATCAFVAASIALTSIIVFGINQKLSLVKGAETPEVWNHYAASDPTYNRNGSKEYWVSCSSHAHSLNAPTTGTIVDATHDESFYGTLTEEDDRYIPSLFANDVIAFDASVYSLTNNDYTLDTVTYEKVTDSVYGPACHAYNMTNTHGDAIWLRPENSAFVGAYSAVVFYVKTSLAFSDLLIKRHDYSTIMTLKTQADVWQKVVVPVNKTNFQSLNILDFGIARWAKHATAAEAGDWYVSSMYGIPMDPTPSPSGAYYNCRMNTPGGDSTLFGTSAMVNGISSIQFDFQFPYNGGHWVGLNFINGALSDSNLAFYNYKQPVIFYKDLINPIDGVSTLTASTGYEATYASLLGLSDIGGRWISMKIIPTSQTSAKLFFAETGNAFDDAKYITMTFLDSSRSFADAYFAFQTEGITGGFSFDNLHIVGTSADISEDFTNETLSPDFRIYTIPGSTNGFRRMPARIDLGGTIVFDATTAQLQPTEYTPTTINYEPVVDEVYGPACHAYNMTNSNDALWLIPGVSTSVSGYSMVSFFVKTSIDFSDFLIKRKDYATIFTLTMVADTWQRVDIPVNSTNFPTLSISDIGVAHWTQHATAAAAGDWFVGSMHAIA